MRERGRPQRGERAQVARRVRALLDGCHAAEPGAVVSAGQAVEPGAVVSTAQAVEPVSEIGWSEPAVIGPAVTAPAAIGPVAVIGSARPTEPLPVGPDPARTSQKARSPRPAVAALAFRLARWLQRHGLRLDPGHRATAAMGVAALVAALFAGWWVMSSRPHAVEVSPSPSFAARPADSSPGSSRSPSTTSGRLVVDVVGKVPRPGVYRVAEGVRVDDVLRLAGGALPGVDLSSLNLARKVVDGEQIAVGAAGAGGPAAGGPVADGPVSGSPGAVPTGSPVDLNTATAQQLDALPGIGPVLAQRILDWRTAHGRFASVDQLREVTGVGPSRYDDLRPLVTV